MPVTRKRQALRKNISAKSSSSEVEGKTEAVVNLIQVFQKIGRRGDRRRRSKSRWRGSSAACYYGCLLTRPPRVVRFDDAEQPRSMEKILEALGAKTVDWGFRTECCGAGMTMANEDIVLDLSHKILTNAKAHGANCLVVACPMCHVNLDMKQADIERTHGVKHDLPVYYLSDLVGRALGIADKELGVDRHFVVRG